MEENVLVLGANSDMAVAIARQFAAVGYSITLAGRNVDRLKPLEADITIRHKTQVYTAHFDALDFDGHQKFYDSLPEKPTVVVCAFGILGDQIEAQRSWNECMNIINANYIGAVSILNVIANAFELRGHGTIVGISSVAGERGRQSNYIYGSAKAGFTAYLSGLRNRLYHRGVHVLTVKPGFVKTKMIENLKTPGPITAQPKTVGTQVLSAVRKKKDSVYVLPIWSPIMMIIRNIPEGIFKRMKM